RTVEAGDWWHYPQSGYAVRESGFWWLRWDLSPLGYLSTAAHGHLDALHVSIWFHHQPIVIDPVTGAYFADGTLRAWLRWRAAANARCPEGSEFPVRRGPFLWSQHHLTPIFHVDSRAATGVLNMPGRQLRREIRGSADGLSWDIVDSCVGKDGRPISFSVRWQ